jgi:hypothetical protein
MFGVEVAGVLGDFEGKRTWRVGKRGAGYAAAVKLAPSGGDAELLGWAGSGSAELGGAQF